MRSLQINNYKIEVPLINIVKKLQLTLTNGKLRDIKENLSDIVVTCPHHAGGKESKPACNIYIGDDDSIPYGYYRCFVCEDQGPFTKFVAECFDADEAFAKKWLIENFGVFSYDNISIASDINITKPNRLANNKFLSINLDSYSDWHPYLAKRKLSPEICKLFQVKFDPKSRCIIFPCFDQRGNIIMLPKRSIDTKTFYLDRDVEKPLYCLDFIQKNNIKSAIITEGPIDCLTAYEYGFPACATLGNVSEYQINQLNNSCIVTLYAMFDNDQWGQKFLNFLKAHISSRIILIEVQFPKGKKDINDLTKEEFWSILKDTKKDNV